MVLTNRQRPQSLRNSQDVNTKSTKTNCPDLSIYIPDDDLKPYHNVSPGRSTTNLEPVVVKNAKSSRRPTSNVPSNTQKVKYEASSQMGKLLQRRRPGATKTIQAKSTNVNAEKTNRSSPRIEITTEQKTKRSSKSTARTSTPLSSPRPTSSPSPIMFNGRPKSTGAEALSKHFDLNNRRSSVATSSPSVTKINSFSKFGKQVSSLLKFKKNFTCLTNSIPENVIEVGEEIRELPKSPRFASYLSPEAQFAVMKGYEDVLHQEISSKLPQYKPHLRRTKTPNNKIQIKHTDRAGFRRSRDDDLDSVSSIYSDEDYVDDYFTGCGSRRASMPATTNFYGFATSPFKDRPRANSSPASVLPREKRLVLTYRFESAMDILDTLRFQSGSSTISPRVNGSPRKILPVKDFNTWTSAWHREFQTDDNSSAVKAWRT